MKSQLSTLAFLVFILVALSDVASASSLDWSELPPIPDDLGFAGSFAGSHGNALIVAGGANFPKPVWENEKVWHDRVWVLTSRGDKYEWNDGGKLPRSIAYGASVSTPQGVLCMGGNNDSGTFRDVFLLTWDGVTQSVAVHDYPPLPRPCAFGAATLIGQTIYLAGGQSGSSLDTAMSNLWSLDLSERNDGRNFRWRELPGCPGPSRALNLTVAQHNGYTDCVYMISGRRQGSEQTEFLRDVWEYSPTTQSWRERASVPRCVMAGTSVAVGQSHVFVLGGATEELYFQGDDLRDDHPGFIRQALAYHTITDTWIEAGSIPENLVTTTAVAWGDRFVIPGGEVRPRVRSPRVYAVSVIATGHRFGVVNYVVLLGYLLAVLGIGVYFTNRNQDTDDYFRGGMQIPWWAAGCSIFATTLSSLTFTGLPAKAFAQDWVYLVGNLTIPLVAIVAVYVAMPFFRRIDATSAYEYLEKRFDRRVRIFGSASFLLFHVFRMAVVMSLTGLALAVATPMTPIQSVLLMGLLSIVYCTMGGIEAVVWTDTIQTFVLLGGALLSVGLLIGGVDGGAAGLMASANDANKFRMANWHLDATQSQIAFWVIVVGALGQNLSSYTADQAVVQRYMTTATERLAAGSIWTNAVLAVPASILFFAIGTALFAFYQSHPEKLDPTITTDQVFPLFISREMPIGVAGLIVSGIFAAAQSTVSTSMNSIATTVVTDFMRPADACSSEDGYLRAARVCTFIVGIIGTLLGILFVNPEIKSLFDTFLIVIGLFMGVLGGLFVLGALTRRGTADGAIFGAGVGAAVMFALWAFSAVNGYLYTTIGITVCFVVGYVASLFCKPVDVDLAGLTLHDLKLKQGVMIDDSQMKSMP